MNVMNVIDICEKIFFFFIMREPNSALYSAVILKHNAVVHDISCPTSVHSFDMRKCFIVREEERNPLPTAYLLLTLMCKKWD